VQFWNIHSVAVNAEIGINYCEALCLVLDELTRWNERGCTSENMCLTLANGGKEIKIELASTYIRRIHRETRQVLEF